MMCDSSISIIDCQLNSKCTFYDFNDDNKIVDNIDQAWNVLHPLKGNIIYERLSFFSFQILKYSTFENYICMHIIMYIRLSLYNVNVARHF